MFLNDISAQKICLIDSEKNLPTSMTNVIYVVKLFLLIAKLIIF